jgi:hypothetical protein
MLKSSKVRFISKVITLSSVLLVGGLLAQGSVQAESNAPAAVGTGEAPGVLSPWEEDESSTRRFIQWPRVTIGLVWSDPASGQMKVMDLGSAPEDGRFTSDVLMSRCMRAAGRLASTGNTADAFSGSSTQTLRPLSDEEVEELIHANSSRK